jgi:hypothetical protein
VSGGDIHGVGVGVWIQVIVVSRNEICCGFQVVFPQPRLDLPIPWWTNKAGLTFMSYTKGVTEIRHNGVPLLLDQGYLA